MRIATRGSALALAQATWVAERLRAAGTGDVELVTVVTAGDRRRDVGDKSRWTGAIERALLDGDADLAVHSAKDVPGDVADGLVIAGAPERAATPDVLVGAASLDDLPAGARIGTSSLRRHAQLRAAREDLAPVELRGNVDTRLAKLAAGEVDALVLALAGLQRLGRDGEVATSVLPFVPAPGQGTLALEVRADDEVARAAVATVTDEGAWTCLRAERAAVRALGATCHTPVGALATLRDGRVVVDGFAGLPDGSAWVADRVEGGADDPEEAGRRLAERMLLAGAREIIDAAERAGVAS